MFTILSCEKGQWDVASSNENDVERTNIISLEEAREELENILKDLNEQYGGASEFSGKVIEEAFTLGRGNVLTRAGNTDSSMMYVFNFADEGGFAIMSGHTDMPPLLALSYSGTFTDESADENPGLGIFLLGLDTMVGDINTGDPGGKDLGGDDSGFVSGMVREYEKIVYMPGGYCSVTWNQGSPYNMLCPSIGGTHCLTGCVATAVAQLMSIYKYPDSYGEYNFDWNEMTAEPNAGDVPESAQEQIASLMAVLGEEQNLDVDYGITSSGAYPSNISRTLENFGYSSGGSLDSYDIDKIVSELRFGRSVLVGGFACKTESELLNGSVSYSSGHRWLCHGLLEQRKTMKEYVNGELKYTLTYSQWYLLCNWGWGGKYDGYFYNGAFDAVNGLIYPANEGVKSTTTDKENNYQYNLTAVTGIRL